MAQKHLTTGNAVQSIDTMVEHAIAEAEPEILVEALNEAADAYREFRKGTSVLDRNDTAALFKDLMQSAYFVIGVKGDDNLFFHTDYVVLTPTNAVVRGLVLQFDENFRSYGRAKILDVECKKYGSGNREIMLSPNNELIMKI